MSYESKHDLFNKVSEKKEFREIPIERIHDVSNNPRYGVEGKAFNERYEEIRETIANTKGKFLVLDVVEQAGNPGHYNIFKGGSTRLSIARELHSIAEVRGVDSDFTLIQCLVFPCVDEAEKLIMTATENITRGSLCFGEKSTALQLLIKAYKSSAVEFKVMEFLDYAERNGVKSLVPNRQEYHYLVGCHEHFLCTGVLNKKINIGRANREFVRSALRIRTDFLKICNSKNVDDSANLWEGICDSVDEPNLTINTLKKAMAKCLKALNLAQINSSPVNKFDEKYELFCDNGEYELTNDNQKNALLIVGEILRTRSYKSTRKKTHKLKAMGIDNELAGLLKLIALLPKSARKIAASEILNVSTGE